MFRVNSKYVSKAVSSLKRFERKAAAFMTKPAVKSAAKKCAVTACMFLVCAIDTYAQSKGAGGFSKATTEISSYQESVSNLMKAIAAVIVLVGAFNVYFKMQNGDQDVKKTIMLTIGGCVAFVAMSEALPLFFK
jgi:hypothetical protein